MKVILGTVAAVLSIAATIPYIIDTYKGTTKPHSISWFIWGTLAGIIFLAQILNGGGSGAWATGMVAALNLFVFFLSLKHGEKHITPFDWTCLGVAIIAILIWLIIKDPTIAIIIISAVDLTGALPTIRKLYSKPYEETLKTYILYFITWTLSLAALKNYNLITVLDTATLLVMNFTIIMIAVIRRGKQKNDK